MSSSGDLWIFAEQIDSRVLPVALELVSHGRGLADKLGTRVVAVLFGANVESQCEELWAHGADTVFLCEDETLTLFRCEPYAALLAKLAEEHKPDILLMGATSTGRDLAPTVAAKLRTGLSADCTGLDVDANGLLLQTTPAWGGAVMATIVCPRARPQMATVRPGVLARRRSEPARRDLVRIVPVLREDQIRVKVRELSTAVPEGVPLHEAEIIVAGGAGVGSPEGWQLIRQLAHKMGATVAGTRPPADDGYISEELVIGQSGQTTRPKLYLGFGVSGEMQHMVGLRDAQVIVAINKDPRAKIIAEADYSIVADYADVVPLLIEKLGQQ